jgi:hypothetical protein
MHSTLRPPALGVFRLPWLQWRQGLLVAALLSVLVHGLTFNALHRSVDFKFNERSGTASLSTRVILVASEQDAGVQTALLVKAPPEVQPTPVQAAPKPPSRAPAPAPAQGSANPQLPPPASTAPEESQNIEQKQPLTGIYTAQHATEIIANSAPSNTQTSAAGEGSAAAQPSLAVPLQYPPNRELEYEVRRVQRGQSFSGTGQLSWKHNGSEYELLLESSSLGISVATQRSTGVLDAMGLAPERFSDKRFNRSEQAAHFRRLQGVVQFSNNKPETALLPGMQDRLSVLLQLAGIIGGNPKRYEIVNRINLPVAGVDGAEWWEVSLEKPLDINVPAANMRAIKLVRKPRHEFDQQLELWLAPEMGYLPIRIRQSDEQSSEGNFTEFSLLRRPR